jgi:transaldolase/glucose-6-phosphate isomerase
VINPLKALETLGQSVWLDFLARDFLRRGDLERLIEDDGLSGVTSNPAIFQKAMVESDEYDEQAEAAIADGHASVTQTYEELAIADIRVAADQLRRAYDVNDRHDGFVSLEVSPYLAHDTDGTIAEARRLWRAVGRENLMIKVPATPAGLPAIRQLISEGININITLLFSQAVYAQVADAYLGGLEALAARGEPIDAIASVASFFVSRIDTAVDKAIAKRLGRAESDNERAALNGLRGAVAIANAKLAYQLYLRLFDGPRWRRLAERGARPQRLLWASTGTKNPEFSDVLYVEHLIGPSTVNTVPPKTLEAFRHHGQVRETLTERVGEAQETLATLERFGISLARITDDVLTDGVRLFADAFDELLGGLARKRAQMLGTRLNGQTFELGEARIGAVTEVAEAWRGAGNVRRLWRRDATLWTGHDEGSWLGWLDIVDRQAQERERLAALAADVRREGFADVLLLGMGGSSLGPEVIGRTFGAMPGFPRLRVLDSTDPQQIRSIENSIDLARTLFIVSSKSGTTLEPNIFMEYFFARTREAVGSAAGQRFIAITDPGSRLEKEAVARGFRAVFHGDPSIGGRYSVLSNFGMVPAAVIGLDVDGFLAATRAMVRACGPDVPPSQNPGVELGLVLGGLGLAGRDKITIVASPGIDGFGAWAEQLIAESTGKNSRGLIPVDGEPLGAPEVYGADRLFVYLRLARAADPAQDEAIARLARAGHPVVRIGIAEEKLLGQEFFRFEMATAVAGAILGIDPFDQPDVEASKVATRELTDVYEREGSLPSEQPVFRHNGVALFADERNAEDLRGAGADASLESWLGAHFSRLAPGDYAATLAYVEQNGAHMQALQELRTLIRDRKRVASCLGFGPRFLHSTGQAYKGGPNSGVFLQITVDDPHDLVVPGRNVSFGIVKAAQARGDFRVLAERGRRVLRAHLSGDLQAGLNELGDAARRALA